MASPSRFLNDFLLCFSSMKYPSPALYLILGDFFTFIGAVIGFVLGATYGGNYPVPFEFAGLPGYEGAGLLGAILISSAIAIAWTRFACPHENRVRITVITAGVCLLELAIQHFISQQSGFGFFLLLLAPMIWQTPMMMSRKK